MTAVAYGWVRVEREVRPRIALGLIHVPTRRKFGLTVEKRMVAKEGVETRYPNARRSLQQATVGSGLNERLGIHDA